MLQSAYKHPEVLIPALDCAQNLSLIPENEQPIIKAGLLEGLLFILQDTTDENVALRIADTLINLSDNDQLKQSVQGKNVIAKLLDLLLNASDSALADSLVSLLTNLAAEDNLRMEIVDLGGTSYPAPIPYCLFLVSAFLPFFLPAFIPLPSPNFSFSFPSFIPKFVTHNNSPKGDEILKDVVTRWPDLEGTTAGALDNFSLPVPDEVKLKFSDLGRPIAEAAVHTSTLQQVLPAAQQVPQVISVSPAPTPLQFEVVELPKPVQGQSPLFEIRKEDLLV